MQVLNIPIIFWQIVENTTDTKELQDNFAIAENKKYVMNKHQMCTILYNAIYWLLACFLRLP